MLTIKDVRAKFPQYGDLSDDQLADSLHRRFYSDIPADQFRQKIGLGGDTASPDAAIQVPADAPSAIPHTSSPTKSGFADELAGLMSPPPPPAMRANPMPPSKGPNTASLQDQAAVAGIRNDLARKPEPHAARAEPSAPDPFAGESFGDLARRRGQEVAQGAGEVFANNWEGLGAMTGRAMRTPQSQRGAADMAANYEATIGDIQTRLQDPSLDQNTRTFLEQNLADLTQGLDRLRPISAGQGMPPEMMQEFSDKAASVRQTVADTFGSAPADTSFWSKMAQGAGSMGAFLATTLGGAAVGGPAGGVGMTAATGATSNAGQVYTEAKKSGADENTALDASGWAFLIGSTEAIPIGRALHYLPSGLRDRVSGWLSRRVGEIVLDAGEEGAQEYLSQVANNILAQQYYDPERGWTDGAAESGIIGAILGGGVGAAVNVLPGEKDKPEDAASPSQSPENAQQAGTVPPVISPQTEAPVVPPSAPQMGAAPAPDAPAAGPETDHIVATGKMVPPAQTKGAMTRAEAEADPQRFEVLPEIEGVGGEAKPTGNFVAFDKTSGRIIPLEENPAAEQGQPGGGDSAGPQPSADGAVGGTGISSAAAQPVPAPSVEADIAAAMNNPAPAAPAPAPESQAPAQAQPADIPSRKIKSDTVKTPTGTPVDVDYAVVDLESLKASNFDDGRINPNYPQERQPRDRTDGKSQMQIERILRDFDPRQLDMSPTTDNGAPIIDRSGIVESGNGRTMMLTRMYSTRPDLAKAYRNHLVSQGYPVDGIKRPVLVRIRTTEMDAQQIGAYTRDSNTDSKLTMSDTEQAMADATALPAPAVELFRGGDLDAAANRDFVRGFVQAVIPENEQGSMVDKATGALNQKLLRRMQGALLAKAYGNPELVQKLIESSENSIKAIGGALMDVAPAWARMRASVASGQVAPEMDQTGALLEAVFLVNRARTEGRNVIEFVKQPDLLSGDGISPMGQRFLALMFRDTRQWTKPAGRDRIVEALSFYLDEAMKTAPGADMFGSSANPDQTLDLARTKQDSRDGKPDAQTDLFAPQAPRGDGERVRPAGADGTGPGQQGATPEVGGQRPEGRGKAAVAPKAQSDAQSAYIAAGAELRAKLRQGGIKYAPARFTKDLTEEPDGKALEIRLANASTETKRRDIARDFVLGQGKATGKEHLVILSNSGHLISLLVGKKDGVEFSTESDGAVSRGLYGWSIHNHPSSRGFSPRDLIAMSHGYDALEVIGHNGARHHATMTKAGSVLASKVRKTGRSSRTWFEDAISAAEGRLREIMSRLVRDGTIPVESADAVFYDLVSLTLARAGLINYDGTAEATIAKHGIDADDYLARTIPALSPVLGRAGLPVPEIGNRGLDRGTGTDAAKPGTERGTGTDAGTTEGRGGRGRVQPEGLKPAPGTTPAPKPAKPSSGNAAIDGALDDLFGDEADVQRPGERVERDSGDAGTANGVGATDVPAAAGRPEPGAAQRGRAAGRGDGKSGDGSGLSPDNAAPVGGAGNQELAGRDQPASKPAAVGKRGPSRGAGAKRVSSDTGRGADAQGTPAGGTGVKQDAAARLAAIRNILKEEVADFATRASVAEDSLGIDALKYGQLEAIFTDALEGTDVAKTSDRDLFRTIIMPLRDAGMTREEVVTLTPYLEAFLANLRAGRVQPQSETEAAPKPIEAEDRATVQAKADRIKPIQADADNIRATLPLLLPEQQDDVLKIETRFAKHVGHGMMVTNGTGTGKTFSGGGAIKRFVQMGKSNILVVAPSEAVIEGWKRALSALGVPVNQLSDTKDAGQGVTITTYANLRDNTALARRTFDLIVTDESQNLMSSQDGSPTGALENLRALSNKPSHLQHRSRMLHAEDWARYAAMKDGEAKTAEYRRLKRREDEEVEDGHMQPRSKVLFLSATPFAYDKCVDYAEGYLFDYPKDGHVGRSRQSGQNLFMVQNFGYRIRYHKLTKPEAAVDSAVFEREFHEKLKREGVLTGRSLQIDVDYDRKFVLAADGLGTKIDAVLTHVQKGVGNADKALADGYRTLQKAISKKFDYLKRMQLLEAIKAKAAIPDIEKHLSMGRKVVVFHDYNVGGGFNPFAQIVPHDDANAIQAMGDLMAAFPDLQRLNFASYAAPVDALSSALGKRARPFNGTVAQKQRLKNLTDFNTDGSGADVLIVQADAGGAGISMHDLTGSHQRVLINLGMPTKPTTTLQEEGRILRVGTVTNAPFRYYTIGTAWERTAFASRIAERSGTVENLALGNQARDLLAGFIEAYEEAEAIQPGPNDGTGGKERDRKANVATPYEKAKTHYFGRTKTTGKRDQRDGIDFYPTPEPLAFKMVEWAGIRPNERVLEPSAGDGSIARYVPDFADLTLVEPSSDLSSRAQLRAPQAKVETSTFETYHLVNKHHVIIMNPPFGSGGKTAYDHLEKAMRHLRPGGRIVALVPTGPMADKRWEALGTGGFAVSTVVLPTVTFEKAGTAVNTRVIIMDKFHVGADGKVDNTSDAVRDAYSRSSYVDLSSARSINELFDRLEHLSMPYRAEPAQDAIADIEGETATAISPASVVVQGPALAPGEGAFKLAKVKHAKTGADLFVATIRDKVDREEYSAILAVAKRHGGYYSSFRGNGAVPGFQFKTDAARAAFLDDMRKPTASLPGVAEESDTFHQMARESRSSAAEISRLAPRLRAELDRLDLKRVKLSVAAGEDGYQGMFQVTGDGAMEITIAASLDPMKTLHHEVIHALRTMNLFTPAEWRALEIMAAKEWVAKHDIAARYPDLLPSEQIEEAIAEEFSEALSAKRAPKGSILVQVFNKIARFLRALRNVLNGAGYQTAEDVFGRILAGEISKRQAGNTGMRAAMAQRASLEDGNQSFQRPRTIRPQTAQGRAHRNSAMGGAIFIPDRQVWEELTRTGQPIWQRLRAASGGARDAVDRARVKLQDRFLPVLRAQEAVINATGKPLPPEQNAYLTETTFSGKVGRHLFEIDEDFVKPIIDLIADTNGALSVEDVGEWLYARHAVERNAHIASINPKMPDGGSGMMNDEAQQILSDAAAGPHAARLKSIGDFVDRLRERTLNLREDSGLITHDEAQMWRQMYCHYVPLKGFAETDHAEAVLDVTGIGRRFSVRGSESKRALGRESEAFNPLQGIITQAQEVAIRAEKNRVGQSLYELAKSYPSKALWTIKKPAQKRYFNRTTGLVETRVEDPISLILEPNETAVKVSGEEVRIVFHDARLARAAGSVGADQMGWFISMMSKLGRWLSSVNTMLDPEFVIRNAFRDMTAAQFNIRNFGDGDRNAIAKAMLRDWRKAFVGVYRGQKNKADTEWTKWYREFEKAGGKVSFWQMDQPEAAVDDMKKRVYLASSGLGPRAASLLRISTRDNPVLGFIERTNMAVDNAIRLAAFVAARKNGWSEQDAASLSKNLTVNFNRRGEWGATINALYVFANASVQGTHTMFRALSNPKRMGKYVLAMAVLGAVLDMVNAWMSEEDDDGELAYDKIPDFKNRTNLMVMLGPDSGAAASLWMPYGYSLFPYAGQQISKVLRGVKKPEDALGDFGSAMLEAFVPFEDGSLQRSMTPTVLDPINEMAMNEDWLGRPIRPENAYADYGPDAYKFFGGASEVSKIIADVMNRATGGDEGVPGVVDISPEYLDHAFGNVVGGAGRFFGRSVDLLAKAASGNFEEIEQRDVPVARSLVYETGDWLDRDRYYRFRDRVREANAAAKTYGELGKPVTGRVAALAGLYQDQLATERALKKTKGDPTAQHAAIMAFNKRFIAVMGRQGE